VRIKNNLFNGFKAGLFYVGGIVLIAKSTYIILDFFNNFNVKKISEKDIENPEEMETILFIFNGKNNVIKQEEAKDGKEKEKND
jgi:hypothetical protein